MTSNLGPIRQDFLKDTKATWNDYKANLEATKKLSVAEYTEIATEICVFAYENRIKKYWTKRHEYQKIVDFCLDSENTFFVVMSLNTTLMEYNQELFEAIIQSGIGEHLVKIIKASKIEDLNSEMLLNIPEKPPTAFSKYLKAPPVAW